MIFILTDANIFIKFNVSIQFKKEGKLQLLSWNNRNCIYSSSWNDQKQQTRSTESKNFQDTGYQAMKVNDVQQEKIYVSPSQAYCCERISSPLSREKEPRRTWWHPWDEKTWLWDWSHQGSQSSQGRIQGRRELHKMRTSVFCCGFPSVTLNNTGQLIGVRKTI